MPTKNKALQRSYIRKHYQANKPYYLQKSREGKERVRLHVRKLKDKPCTDCKERYPYYVMDFDHRPESHKAFRMTNIHVYSSIKKAEEEAAKCDVVCSNCHRIRTFNRIKEPRANLAIVI